MSPPQLLNAIDVLLVDDDPGDTLMIREAFAENKVRNELACGRVRGQLFASCLLARGAPLPAAIVPVPLALRRYRQRGYNQASELALSIRRVTGVAVRSDIAIRQRETAEQAGLDRKARRRNVTEWRRARVRRGERRGR